MSAEVLKKLKESRDVLEKLQTERDGMQSSYHSRFLSNMPDFFAEVGGFVSSNLDEVIDAVKAAIDLIHEQEEEINELESRDEESE